MKWNPESLEESLFLFNFFCRVLCLRASECLQGWYKNPLIMLHLIVVWFFRVWSTTYKWFTGEQSNLIVSLALSLFMVAAVFHNIGMMTIHLANIYFTKSYMMFIKKMVKIDETLAILGAPIDHRKHLYYCCYLFVVIVMLSITILVVDLLAAMPNVSNLKVAWMAVMTTFWFINDMILILDFCVAVRAVCVRFEAINNFLVTLALTMAGSKSHERAKERSIEDLNAWCFVVSRPRRESKRILYAIHIVKQVYLQLGREAAVLCKIYAIQITVAIGLSITFTTTIVYNLYTRLFNIRYAVVVTVPEILGSITFCIAFVFDVILINSCCEHAIHQAEKTKSLIHALHGVSTDTELRNEVQQLALEVALRPIKFMMFGYNLNYSLVRSYFGCVSTYLLISIQLGG